MSGRKAGLVVLAIQLAVVLSIGAKYAWERHHCPMVWARSQQYDPGQPLRGRYLAIALEASACGLPGGPDAAARANQYFSPGPGDQEWRVIPAARNGQLAPIAVDDTRPGFTQELALGKGIPCDRARLIGTSDFFIPEHARSPFPLQKGQELWALVTVPPSGPVRPVKLAVSDSSGFHVLNLD